tara:strand:+ start:282 stop:596 length:315 start_codon:yes stop_codon:yes gene_type:complete
MQTEPRERMFRQAYVWIRFIVPEQDVVYRPIRFDQTLFEKQRFGFASRRRDLNIMDLVHQSDRLSGETRSTEVTRDSTPQIASFAYIKDVALTIEHAVNAGTTR